MTLKQEIEKLIESYKGDIKKLNSPMFKDCDKTASTIEVLREIIHDLERLLNNVKEK
jgi:cob(I)alamin adenosyltransferase